MTKERVHVGNNRGATAIDLDPAVHRRILTFLNKANYPTDLEYDSPAKINFQPNEVHERDRTSELRKRILDQETARQIIDFKDREHPLGFRNLREVFGNNRFDFSVLDTLRDHFGEIHFGR